MPSMDIRVLIPLIDAILSALPRLDLLAAISKPWPVGLSLK